MSCKAAETTHNINKGFGSRIADECTVQWWFKKFCKGNFRALKMRSMVDDHWRLTTTN